MCGLYRDHFVVIDIKQFISHFTILKPFFHIVYFFSEPVGQCVFDVITGRVDEHVVVVPGT